VADAVSALIPNLDLGGDFNAEASQTAADRVVWLAAAFVLRDNWVESAEVLLPLRVL
jgi:hypothetical protein